MPKIAKGYRENFNTLTRAAKAGDLALLDAMDTETGRPVVLVVAVALDGEEYTLTPFAVMIDGNPFARYLPPAVDGPGYDRSALQ